MHPAPPRMGLDFDNPGFGVGEISLEIIHLFVPKL
jgi:hypothetical protein